MSSENMKKKMRIRRPYRSMKIQKVGFKMISVMY